MKEALILRALEIILGYIITKVQTKRQDPTEYVNMRMQIRKALVERANEDQGTDKQEEVLRDSPAVWVDPNDWADGANAKPPVRPPVLLEPSNEPDTDEASDETDPASQPE